MLVISVWLCNIMLLYSSSSLCRVYTHISLSVCDLVLLLCLQGGSSESADERALWCLSGLCTQAYSLSQGVVA